MKIWNRLKDTGPDQILKPQYLHLSTVTLSLFIIWNSQNSNKHKIWSKKYS